ncbi:DUF4131 domain-containing protein [Siculibacillus lacustris]|uniref:DUF4131 domain-containing protein n=1 Tax=Siculibacillus lacustris TaxID=1549641 RepID=A0A4Q9VRI9_9HYPH|nr:ComEC/Rec2 family competence protein [Siculibacillus lacustris]TBW38494.1 DUF4131 domain-containing protein [Siculibacillus lacustris]
MTGAELHPGGSIGATVPAGSGAAPLASLAIAGSWRLRLAAFARRAADAVEDDLGDGLGGPLLVVVYAFGIAAYFTVLSEPWLPASVAVALAAIVATMILRRRGHAARGLAVFAALAAGVASGSLETRRWAAPRLDHARTVTVTGRVVDLDATVRGGTRLGLAVTRMEGRGLTPETTPRVISATLAPYAAAPRVGDGVTFRARLKPPEGPVLPGGYDFARRAYFEGRGASGYVLGRASPADVGPPSTLDRLLAPIGDLRHTIADRVRASLPGASGAIGAAIMVGEQRAIPDAAAEALRASGLTHIVSISGLHMSLVAGGVIATIRLILAAFPAIALRFPIRKWAAAAAILVTTVYLLLSGNQVAALRSYLMLSVALVAVMLDRPALTMHTIAVSAAAILVVDPSAAMEPSFQMSYLAVIALVASWDLWRLWLERRPPPEREAGLVAHALHGVAMHVQGLAFSSLIAGLATAPVIAGVFFRGAPYSILANMIVLPVTGLLIMPAAVLAALAMPFGLDAWPLWAMGLGIDFMVAVGRWAAALPGGAGLIGAPHPAMMPLGIVAVLWLSVWRSKLRLLGLVPALLATAALFMGPRPDISIGRHGSPVAVRDATGRLHVLATRQDRFDTANWLAAAADSRPPDDPTLAAGWRCDPLGCVFRLAAGSGAPTGADPTARSDGSAASASARQGADDGVSPTTGQPPNQPTAGRPPGEAAVAARDLGEDDLVIAVVRHPRGFDEDCRRAALIVTALIAPDGCRARTTVIDRIDLATSGATTLRFTGPPLRRALGGPAPTAVAPTPAPLDPTAEPGLDPIADPVFGRAAGPPGEGIVGPGPEPGAGSARTGPTVVSTAVGAPVTTEPAAFTPSAAPKSPPIVAGAVEAVAVLEPPIVARPVAITTSLPSPPRPWTPVDPLAAAIRAARGEAASIAAADAAAASATVEAETAAAGPPSAPAVDDW